MGSAVAPHMGLLCAGTPQSHEGVAGNIMPWWCCVVVVAPVVCVCRSMWSVLRGRTRLMLGSHSEPWGGVAPALIPTHYSRCMCGSSVMVSQWLTHDNLLSYVYATFSCIFRTIGAINLLRCFKMLRMVMFIKGVIMECNMANYYNIILKIYTIYFKTFQH